MSTQGTADAGREVKASRPVGTAGLIVRLVVVGLDDALLIWALASSAQAQWWLAVGFFVFALVAINVTYLSGRFIPLKFLLPGVLFLIVFQLYTMAFTAFSSFTNYGTGHLDDKSAAIVAIQGSSVVPVEGGRQYAVVPIVKDGVVSMLIVDPDTGGVSIGTNEGVTPVPDDQVVRDGDKVTGVTGYESLNLGTLSSNPDYTAQWEALQPPLNAEQGSYVRAISVTKATEARPRYVYDPAQDAMIDTSTGEVFPADESVGNFVSSSGE